MNRSHTVAASTLAILLAWGCSNDASGGTDAGAPGPESTGPSAGCGETAPEGSTFSLNIQNKERQYIVRVPGGYDVNIPYVLVFGFHGLGGTMQGVDDSGYFGMQQVAGDEAIFISPNGYESSDDYDTPVSGNGFWDENGQDVEFVAAIVEWAKANLCVDTARIFSIGHSFGGMMSDNIGCKLTSSFRAIAPASSSFRRVYVDLDTDCTGQPIAAMLTHGTNDNFVPFEEGVEARDYFLGVNGCSSGSTRAMPSGCVDYDGCREGYPVMWCEHMSGHGVWDNAGTGTSLGATAWEFFSQF